MASLKSNLAIAAFAVATMAGTALGSSSAEASVLITDVQLAGPAAATGSNQVGGYYTGYVNGEYIYDAALIFTINGNQVLVNCDDLFHNVWLGPQSTTMTVSQFSSLTTPASNFNDGSYDAAQIGQMSWLLDTGAALFVADAGASLTTAAQQTEQLDLAALQLASWEVGSPAGSGVSFSGFDSAVSTQAATYIAESVGKTAFHGSTVLQLTGNVQAQLMDPILTPVPEPTIWAMMLAGFGSIGFMLRRSRRKQLGALQA